MSLSTKDLACLDLRQSQERLGNAAADRADFLDEKMATRHVVYLRLQRHCWPWHRKGHCIDRYAIDSDGNANTGVCRLRDELLDPPGIAETEHGHNE